MRRASLNPEAFILEMASESAQTNLGFLPIEKGSSCDLEAQCEKWVNIVSGCSSREGLLMVLVQFQEIESRYPNAYRELQVFINDLSRESLKRDLIEFEKTDSGGFYFSPDD